MTIELISQVLALCTVINFGILLWWALVIALAHDWVYRMHGKLFKISIEKFDATHYTCLTLFKTGIILFNLVPYLALRIAG